MTTTGNARKAPRPKKSRFPRKNAFIINRLTVFLRTRKKARALFGTNGSISGESVYRVALPCVKIAGEPFEIERSCLDASGCGGQSEG